ncbi:redoxin domain-containing protein [Chitinophaga sp. SYP-B3965]|uniref:TlpA family protein disulfide reductase n=1 Tax=Chitinophaga sp. SYP-B3965 TaxID=2663120 RepID=UPI001299B385|nr:TlpA disulfide reductase family protein [Chitinophaga sp. SYP-B3965]MRG47040.1 redoxin domain-containing protein [Chitinophaga sp. SYP-B3965]
MKKLSIILLFCFPAFSQAQEVTRIKAAELEQLMQHPDSAIVINLWATWCGPCVKEMPYFVKQAQKFPQVKFIFLSLDMKDAYPEQITKFIRKRKIRSAVVWLDEPNANKYANKIDPRWEGSIPATIFINSKKGYRKFVEGMMTEKELIEELERLN